MRPTPPPRDWETRFANLAREVKDPRLTDFYQAAEVSAQTPVAQVPFLALDLETTGLNANIDVIVSVGFVPLTWNRIDCHGAENWIIRPDQSPDQPRAEIHGITHSRLDASPNFKETLAPLLQAMAGHVILAHYSKIERDFLNKACMDLCGQPLEFPVVDTMDIEARKHPRFTPNFFQRLMGAKPSPSLRLADARERYGLPRYTPHHALTDALATAELFMAQLADQYSPDTPVGELLI